MQEPENYLDSNSPIQERVENLLSKMTLEEKVSQLKARVLPLLTRFLVLEERLSEVQKERFREFQLPWRTFWDCNVFLIWALIGLPGCGCINSAAYGAGGVKCIPLQKYYQRIGDLW